VIGSALREKRIRFYSLARRYGTPEALLTQGFSANERTLAVLALHWVA